MPTGFQMTDTGKLRLLCMAMQTFTLLALVVSWVAPAHAEIVAPTWECLKRASDGLSIPIVVILGIAKTEGGRVGMESRNSNGSYDLGPMQVNDRVWVPVLAQYIGGNAAAARTLLRDHGCANIVFATWIVRQLWNESGSLATAVGWYHSRTPVHMNRYQDKFRTNLLDMMAKMQSRTGG